MQYCPHCMNPATGEICPSCGGQVRWQAPGSQLPVGTLLRSNGGHVYQIGAAKGQGGFGITYAALDLMNQSRVAIKEYYPSRCATRDNVTRVIPATGQQDGYQSGLRSFLEEGRMLSAVGALPSVVSVRDFFESNGTAYIVMEYVDGIPLHEVVRRKGRMSRDELFAILPALLRDIGILHRAGVIHRDISPDNLILTKEGKLKLLDFGSARSIESGKTMTVMLKAGFSPVEQYQSKGQGPYTDVYALAGTVYYCLTGVVPPTAIERFTEDELQLPNSLGAGLTAQQQDALIWGMTVQPQARPQNMEAFSRALFPGQQSGGHVHQTGNQGQQPGGYTYQTGNQGQQPGGYTYQTGSQGQQPGGYTYQTGSQGQQPGGHTYQTGNQGQQPGANTGYAPKPEKKSFGKGLFIGIGAAVVVVALVVAVVLLTGVLDSGKKNKPTEEEEDVYVRSGESTTAPLLTPSTTTPAPSGESMTSEDGYVYEIVNGEAVITGYVGDDIFLVFPDELDGYTVTVLAEGSFAGNTTIQSALLPIYCTEIRANAFYGCTDLRDVSCYSTVQVDPSAFTGCVKLRAVKRGSDDSVDSWVLPADCKVYVSGMDTGYGTLATMDVDDNGVIYGLTGSDEAVILDIPGDITYLEVPESRYGYPVMWIWEGAMENVNPNLVVYMCPNLAFDPSLVYSAEWDCEDIVDFCYNWYMTCVLCDDINNMRTDGGTVVPDRLVLEVAMIRAKELATDYSYSRPDGSSWGDLLNEHGAQWSYAYAENAMISADSDNFNAEFEADMEAIEEVYAGTHSSGEYYDTLGAALYYDAELGYIYIHAIGIVQ